MERDGLAVATKKGDTAGEKTRARKGGPIERISKKIRLRRDYVVQSRES